MRYYGSWHFVTFRFLPKSQSNYYLLKLDLSALLTQNRNRLNLEGMDYYCGSTSPDLYGSIQKSVRRGGVVPIDLYVSDVSVPISGTMSVWNGTLLNVDPPIPFRSDPTNRSNGITSFGYFLYRFCVASLLLLANTPIRHSSYHLENAN